MKMQLKYVSTKKIRCNGTSDFLFVCKHFQQILVQNLIDFISNKRTVPNKTVLLGKIPKINKRTVYVYLDP